VIVLAAAAALLLSACSGSGAKSDAASTPKASTAKTADLGCDIKPGDVSNGVKVTGAVGSAPTVDVAKGLTAKTEERTVLTTGTGVKPAAGTSVVVGFAAYDSTSGASISAPFGWGETKGELIIQLGDGTKVPGLTHTFGCAPVGSRIVYAAPASTAFGSADNVSSNFTDGSVKATDTIVFTGDVLEAIPQRADGADQAPKAGFPTVKLASDGQPKVTYDKASTPPSATEIEVLKKGTGAVVKAGETVTVQYQGTEWKSGKIFDESWGTAHGGTFPSTPASFPTTGVVKGFSDALVGQPVGSQVLVVMTPADGYGANPPANQTTITKDSTLIFVVDILYTAPTPAQQ